MKLKPSKCRSFSLKSGSPEIVHFDIEGYKIPSIAEEEQKFLGRVLFYSGKSKDCFNLLESVIKEKIENLDNTAVRSEFKLEIYQIYILPSIRFLLTIHDVPKTHLMKLDTMVDQYLKKWAGLPRCATTAILHLDTALNIKNISTLYAECHAVTHAATRLKGDSRVNSALDNKIRRESAFVRKNSITVASESVFQSAFNQNCVQGEIPGTTPENPPTSTNDESLTLPDMGPIQAEPLPTPAAFINEVKKDVKSKVISEENQQILRHVQTLIKQGSFLEMTKLEQTDATWQSYVYNLPKGTMKWLLNSSIDTLPTKVNLKQWGKVTSDKCFCHQRETLNHILNCCKVSLNQGRYTLRHDSVLNYIAQCLDKSRYTCYIDIAGHQTPAGGTVPAEMLVTTLRPDIVIVDQRKKCSTILELTIPGETRIKEAHRLKSEKYQHFATYVKTHKVTVLPFEIGSHTGHITRENRKTLHTLHKFCQKDIKLKQFEKNISAVVVLSSYYIFNCRNESNFEGSNFILSPLPNQ